MSLCGDPTLIWHTGFMWNINPSGLCKAFRFPCLPYVYNYNVLLWGVQVENQPFLCGVRHSILLGDVCFDSTVATVDNVGVLSFDASVRAVGVHVGGCR